jgi:glucose/arabinose dehydrogenase
VVCIAAVGLLAVLASTSAAQTLPSAFRDKVVFSGLTQPTAVAFSPDGRVFVAEKRGVIKVFASLTATTPTVFADLGAKTYNYWDRGMLGLALHPNFPATPYVYVLYAYNGDIGGAFPKYVTPGDIYNDPCPSPPGATTNGCTISGRLSRLTANGNVSDGSELVLIHDWFQQFPSHSIGTITFGSDGALYATGGDGASFNYADYGQTGNPGGDPPSPAGTNLTPPTAEGGALRSQDLRTFGDPVTLAGTLIRIDPNTGAGLPDNPLASDPDPNAKRVIAYGLRNPFRFTFRPGTSEIWIGDVGYNTWEEINRIQNPAAITNFGWPCYEGVGHQPSYDNLNLNICANLYAESGAVTPPHYTYNHSAKIVPGETCSTGSSSTSGIAFYSGTTYPAQYQNALFFADYSRQCIWTMLPGSSGTPDPAQIQNFVTPASSPVQIVAGPAGDLFYVDINGGKIHRIQYFVPNAVISANPTTGPAPLTVAFDGRSSTDPDPTETLSYSWDLNGDGVFGDATTAQTSYTYEDPGDVTVTLRVTDTHGGVDTETVVIHANNSPPTPTITAPAGTLTWKVGDPISFAGSATDPQDGTLADSALTWTLLIHHCPSDCHIHTVQSYVGIASGSFAAPDHEYPSHLELKLTATDTDGLQATTSVLLFPQTVTMAFETSPTGLQLSWDATTAAAPFNNAVIIGSQNTVSAPVTQLSNGSLYEFVAWSDGGAATHTVIASASPATLTATYALRPPPASLSANPSSVVGGSGSTGTVTLSGPAPPSGATVSLSSSNPAVASVPANVLVPAGSTSATFPISTAGVGISTTVTLTASYGTGSTSGGVTVIPPNVPPTVSITSPSNGATFTAPASVLIQASATDPDGLVARVDFYVGGNLLGSATSEPFSYTWSNVASGSYTLTAVATDSTGAPTTSTPVSIAVSNPSGIPVPWLEQDIGAVGVPGSSTYNNGTYTVLGSGADIYGSSDQFHFVYQPVSGDGQILARVVSLQNTNSYAKVGVMIRQSLTNNSPHAMMLIEPIKVTAFMWRLTSGTATSSVGSNAAAPQWLRLVRSGSTFTGYRSADGVNWIQVGTTTVNLTGNVYVGLAVTSHNNTTTSTTVFDNVSLSFGTPNVSPTAAITSPSDGATLQDPSSVPITALASDGDGFVTQVAFYDGANLLGTLTSPPFTYNWSNPPAGAHSLTVRATDNAGAVTTSAAVGVTVAYTPSSLPAPWQQLDIGAVGVPGSGTYANGSYTVLGSGADIYGSSDQFRFVYQTLSGDGEIVARVASVQNTNSYAKAGVMIRQSLTNNSPHAMMLIEPSRVAAFMWRPTAGTATSSAGATAAAPQWVRLVRSGNTFTGYRSADGVNWIQVGSTVTVNLTGTVYVGLAVTSHNNNTTGTTVFDNVTKIGN